MSSRTPLSKLSISTAEYLKLGVESCPIRGKGQTTPKLNNRSNSKKNDQYSSPNLVIRVCRHAEFEYK